VLASTHFENLPDSVVNTEFGSFHGAEDFNDAERVAHVAGRSCYQSWNMPNPDTSTDMGYINNILNQGHHSVLEHASVTFYVEGVSRNMTHELIRHRHLSYSELSQRFIDMSKADVIVPPACREVRGVDQETIEGSTWAEDYEELTEALLEDGKTRKQAREAARFVLPSGMETKIVVSGNHRAWRDMLHKRYSVHADAEIREFATLVLAELRKIAPAIYQDFPDQPFN
jgi:thymidylate synthase (FAD)